MLFHYETELNAECCHAEGHIFNVMLSVVILLHYNEGLSSKCHHAESHIIIFMLCAVLLSVALQSAVALKETVFLIFVFSLIQTLIHTS